MDTDALVSEIYKRVMQKLTLLNQKEVVSGTADSKDSKTACKAGLIELSAIKQRIDAMMTQGVTAISRDDAMRLLQVSCEKAHEGEIANTATASSPSSCDCEEAAYLEKKIITEKDIRTVCEQKKNVLYVRHKTILTDLAKEYAAAHGLRIECSECG